MSEQSKVDVSKWQTGRPRWVYTPALWFYFRMIEVAYLDAKTTWRFPDPRGIDKPLIVPSNEALLARDWIARSQVAPAGSHEFVSFPACCEMLGLDAEQERAALLDAIDKAVDSDNDEAWARLDELSAREPVDDAEPLFDAPRCVPALDQMALFTTEVSNGACPCDEG